jgi:hypothetical protein
MSSNDTQGHNKKVQESTAPIFHPEENGVSKQGVCHTVTWPFTLKSICGQKKNYGNSNISPCKSLIFKNSSKRNQKILKDIITLELISSFNMSQNIIFQKSSYQNRPIT